MSKSTVLVIIDDLTGEEISQDDCRTVVFSVGGEVYNLDTNDAGVESFHNAISPFISRARVVTPEPDVNRARTIRQWAISMGRDVPSRGRLPLALIREYEDAMSS